MNCKNPDVQTGWSASQFYFGVICLVTVTSLVLFWAKSSRVGLRFCFPSKFMVYGLWLMFFRVWGGKASVFRNSSQVDSYEDGIGVIIQTRSNLKRNRQAEQDDSVWVNHSFPLRTVCRQYENGQSPLLSVPPSPSTDNVRNEPIIDWTLSCISPQKLLVTSGSS